MAAAARRKAAWELGASSGTSNPFAGESSGSGAGVASNDAESSSSKEASGSGKGVAGDDDVIDIYSGDEEDI